MNVTAQLKILLRLFMYAKKNIYWYALGILGVASQSFLYNLVYAIGLGGLTRAAIQRDPALLRETLLTLGLSLLALTLLMPVFVYSFDSSLRKMTGNLRKHLFSRIQKIPMGSFEGTHSADLLSRLNNDVQTAENAYGWQFAFLMMSLIAGIGSSIVIFSIDYRIAVASILVGIGNLLVNGIFARPVRKLSNEAQEKLSLAAQRLSDILASFQVAKIYNIGKILLQKYMEANLGLLNVSMKRAKWQSAINSMNWFLAMMNFIGLLTLGGFLVVRGDMEFSSLVMTVQMMNGVVWMFSAVGSFYTQVQRSLAGAVRVFEVIDMKGEDEDSVRVDKSPTLEKTASSPAICFDSVSFGYNGETSVLNDFEAIIQKNEKIAIVGSSGSGKSTIFKLLLGFYPINVGDVTIYGKSLKDYTKAELRNLTAYVPQDSYLFEGTILENLSYGKPDAEFEEIVRAAKAAYAHDFISELPQGYNTKTGERGSRLSGGERQRIAIARAFLKNAPILLLDEATSSLDSESEQHVQNALEALMQGRTTLIVAHRLSTIQNADRILVVENGMVAEQGDHKDLLSKNGLYANLYSISQ